MILNLSVVVACSALEYALTWSVRGRLPKSYWVSAYQQDIHIELPHRVISLALKTDCRKHFKSSKRLPR